MSDDEVEVLEDDPTQNKDDIFSIVNGSGSKGKARAVDVDCDQAMTIEDAMAHVLEILPDVEPQYLRKVIAEYQKPDALNCVEQVLHALFEDSDYPKAATGSKRKRDTDSADERSGPTKIARIEVDYASKNREFGGGPFYTELALTALLTDFPFIPKPFIRQALLGNKSLYAPTHLQLLEEQKRPKLAYKTKTTKTKVPGKCGGVDVEFLAEKEWLQSHFMDQIIKEDEQAAEEFDQEENGGIECGCCFSTYPFDKMIQCPECHLFCRPCMLQYAETLLGSQSHEIVCMDQSSCKALFPEQELERFLTPKLLELYHRIKQRKEIEAAGLSGLDECPFCDFQIEIENIEEKLLRCGNESCLEITCRSCKKRDHLPKSCQGRFCHWRPQLCANGLPEVEDDRRIDGRHAVEEALTKALMRNCPKCSKSFIKEDGCNKMTCPDCRTMSCYICRQVVNGYDHFDRGEPTSTSKKRCPLWDGSAQINEQIREAAKKAAEEYQTANPDIEDKEIAVDIPQVAGAHPRGGLPRPHPPVPGLQAHQVLQPFAMQQHHRPVLAHPHEAHGGRPLAPGLPQRHNFNFDYRQLAPQGPAQIQQLHRMHMAPPGHAVYVPVPVIGNAHPAQQIIHVHNHVQGLALPPAEHVAPHRGRRRADGQEAPAPGVGLNVAVPPNHPRQRQVTPEPQRAAAPVRRRRARR